MKRDFDGISTSCFRTPRLFHFNDAKIASAAARGFFPPRKSGRPITSQLAPAVIASFGVKGPLLIVHAFSLVAGADARRHQLYADG